MFRTSQHGNGLSATLLGSLGRLALGVVLSVAVCLGFSLVFVAGCGGEKDETAAPATETAAAPVANTTQTAEPVPVASPATPAQPVTQEKPVVAEKAPAKAKPAATPKPVVAPPPAPVAAASVAPQPVVLALGTVLESTLQSTVSTDKNGVGDAVTLRTSAPVMAEGRTVVPAGAVVHGRVTHVRSAGRMKGAAELTVRFTELELPSGERVAITCDPLRRVAKGDGRETAAEIGAGAVVGGALGGVLGGKDDVLKGAAIGTAVGTGVAVATKGEQIVLPAGQTVKVTLAAPLTLPANS